jgi:hypothetical protein
MNKYSAHERASLGLRQTINDIQCAVQHMDILSYSVDVKIKDIAADIEAIKQHLALLLVQLEQCQHKVYADWHESQPPLP